MHLFKEGTHLLPQLRGEVDFRAPPRLAVIERAARDLAAEHFFKAHRLSTELERVFRALFRLSALILHGILDKSLEKNFCTVPQFWDNAVQDGTLAKLNSLDKGGVCDLLGISVCGDYETWKYYIAVATSETAKFEFEKLIIPASKWAIFSGKGTNVSLQDLERRVITEWLPFSGFEYGNAPDIERYIQADPENAEYEYWLSIRNEKK